MSRNGECAMNARQCASSRAICLRSASSLGSPISARSSRSDVTTCRKGPSVTASSLPRQDPGRAERWFVSWLPFFLPLGSRLYGSSGNRVGTGGRRLRVRHGKKDAERNNEAARLWISGLETVNRKLGVPRVINLSATPFFLRGAGYAEGMLFPWTMSDFSLMDAIECGIVKLPRVPVAGKIPGAENVPGDDMPMSKLIYDYVSGFHRQKDDGFSTLENGRLALFSNFDEHGNPLPRPDTLLIDSEQLESGEGLDDDSRGMAAAEHERLHPANRLP